MEERLGKNTFFTSEDLFREIKEKVQKDGKWPENLLDYDLPGKPVDLWDYHFSPEFILSPGACEGYYLDLGIRGVYGKENETSRLCIGIVKTLNTDPESIRKMAALYGELLIAYEKVVDEHLDDLTRKGYDIHFFIGEKEKPVFGYTGLFSYEKAENRFRKVVAQHPQRYSHGVIRNNLTREKIVIKVKGDSL